MAKSSAGETVAFHAKQGKGRFRMAVRRPEYRCLEGPRRSVGSISPSPLLFVQTGDPTKQNGGDRESDAGRGDYVEPCGLRTRSR